jgi:hypothetical protein
MVRWSKCGEWNIHHASRVQDTQRRRCYLHLQGSQWESCRLWHLWATVRGAVLTLQPTQLHSAVQSSPDYEHLRYNPSVLQRYLDIWYLFRPQGLRIVHQWVFQSSSDLHADVCLLLLTKHLPGVLHGALCEGLLGHLRELPQRDKMLEWLRISW